jgi:molybdopterin-guanine dinucleotide biosynthesis protein A
VLTIVIQAGGESRRMGRDKALMPFLGRLLVERVIGRVSHLADELLVTTNRPQDYTFLGIPLFSDLAPGRGALGGLFTALSAASQKVVAVVACDMPFVSAGLLAFERDLLLAGNHDAVIPKSQGKVEPFHAVYNRKTCVPAVEEAIRTDQWRVNSWFDKVDIRFLSFTEVESKDPLRLAFRNVNTPEELEEAERLAAWLDEHSES